MATPKQIVQIAKDTAASVLFLISSGLAWWYTHKLIIAGIIIALAVDVAVAIWAMVEARYTLADIKDIWGIVCLIVVGSVALSMDEATKDRLTYSIIFGTLGLVDCACVIAHLRGIMPIYTTLLFPCEEIEETEEPSA